MSDFFGFILFLLLMILVQVVKHKKKAPLPPKPIYSQEVKAHPVASTLVRVPPVAPFQQKIITEPKPVEQPPKKSPKIKELLKKKNLKNGQILFAVFQRHEEF